MHVPAESSRSDTPGAEGPEVSAASGCCGAGPADTLGGARAVATVCRVARLGP